MPPPFIEPFIIAHMPTKTNSQDYGALVDAMDMKPAFCKVEPGKEGIYCPRFSQRGPHGETIKNGLYSEECITCDRRFYPMFSALGLVSTIFINAPRIEIPQSFMDDP